MRFILSFFLLVIICLFGLFLHRKTLKKLVFYTDFLQFCKNLQTEIGFFHSKMPSIISKQNFSADFSHLLSNCLGGNMHSTLEKFSYLKNEDKNEIENFFKRLGRSGVDGEKNEIQNMISVLEEKIKEMKTISLKKSKLKFSLCVMFGLFVFIILI